jgi:hypothetical protein
MADHFWEQLYSKEMLEADIEQKYGIILKNQNHVFPESGREAQLYLVKMENPLIIKGLSTKYDYVRICRSVRNYHFVGCNGLSVLI